jgi:hypothetical protein
MVSLLHTISHCADFVAQKNALQMLMKNILGAENYGHASSIHVKVSQG